jgi:hypothetical protein
MAPSTSGTASRRLRSAAPRRKPRLQSLAVKGGAESPAWAAWLGLGVSARSISAIETSSRGGQPPVIRPTIRVRWGSRPGGLAEQHFAQAIDTQRHACSVLLLDQPVGEQQELVVGSTTWESTVPSNSSSSTTPRGSGGG